MSSFKDIKAKSDKYLFQNYGRIPLSFDHGQGCYLFDSDGKRYLDLVAGIAVNSIGYSHPDWVKAVQDQAARMAHVSNLYHVEQQADLAERIASISPEGIDRTLFVNSGAEANEAALKMAVKYTGRHKVMSALNGFHGRTSASLGATGQVKYQSGFEPLISDAYEYYEYGDPESVKRMITKDVAAVLVEPIQGEGGVITADAEFFRTVRDLCTDSGALMIVDEVQTGIGRTGEWFGIDNFGVVPDAITMAKALGGGVPIGALAAKEEYAMTLVPGTHGTTFGGSPLVCAAGCATLDIMERENLVQNSKDLGAKWRRKISSIGSDKIKDVRGYGLMIGVEMDSPETASNVQAVCRENGVLVNVAHGKTVRLIPPLIIDEGQTDVFTDMLADIIR
ncbi:acetylornithine transaminase [Candidatus Methanoprimaticola sp. MG2]|uniref:acetylornithine transaminase n=1 Tax=Candidatus Methanoprimaticola sp. MG2 TaxID=3228838 RepID=UPI0039C5C02D